MTNIAGQHSFALNLAKDDGIDHRVVSFTGQTDVKARSDPFELIFQVAGATFQNDSNCSLTVDLADSRVGNRMLHVHRPWKEATVGAL